MKMITTRASKSAAVITTAALLALYLGPTAYAAPAPITISGAAGGTNVLASNGSSTVLGSFSPDLNLASGTNVNLEKSATSSTQAYYGVDVSSATSSSNVHWRITVHNDSASLASGDVSVAEVGTYNATTGKVRSTPAAYTATESAGDLVLEGSITGWNISAGDQFTNVDEITFASGAPTGTYTFTRTLVDENTGTTFDNPFSFTVNLTAASSSSATTVNAPVVTYPDAGVSTSTNPVTLYGTADANSSIMITGGASSATATTSAGGTWSADVNLTASSTNTLSITASDSSGNTSSSTSFVIVSTATSTSEGGGGGSGSSTSTPVITLQGAATTTAFACNKFADPGASAVDSLGNSIDVSSTGTTTLDTKIVGTPQYITYTANDSSGNTATTTRTVVFMSCSSGGGISHSSSGISRAASVTPSASIIPGRAVGLSILQSALVPPGLAGIPATGGEVLGASTYYFAIDLGVGSRGQDVIELQTALAGTGLYKGPITGYFGALTRAAVMTLQRNNGLPATGHLDLQTRTLLNS